jgi:hypothetical protein
MTQFVLLSKMKCNITQSKIFKKWEVSPNIKLNHEGTDYTATSTSRANLNVSGYGYKLSTNTEYFDGFISEISDTIISLSHHVANLYFMDISHSI